MFLEKMYLIYLLYSSNNKLITKLCHKATHKVSNPLSRCYIRICGFRLTSAEHSNSTLNSSSLASLSLILK